MQSLQSAETPFLPRRPVQRAGSQAYAPGVVEAVFERSRFMSDRAAANRVVADAGASTASDLDLPDVGRVVEVLHVAPGSEDAVVAQLRANPLVQNAARAAVRYAMSTNASLAFPNDPYFNGFAPANAPPFYTTANSPGQWDMHVICAANAWAYGDANSTNVTHAGALGGTAAIAIIDTGADTSHPDLSGRIIYTESDINGVTTQGNAAVNDTDGHGTNVAGIAAASANNGIGFAGVAYAAPLQIYRVFGNQNCPKTGCTALGSDVGLAISHAVANGAKVISMSLGSSSADPAEENAVASAVAAGVVVVAASGNEHTSTLDYPAVDPGVIPVGASALDDSTGTVTETVASYSNYSAANPSSWGVVAPGGDPSGSTDNDDLHWIENIYTSQATDSSSFCIPDHNNPTGPNDCRVLIAGTSQATPHVAGAASLLLSVGASPANIKTILCSTATPIAGGKAGCGRLNVYKAMASVVGDPSP